VQAVVQAAQESVEQVALGGDVAVPGVLAAVVVGAGAPGEAVSAAKAQT
jgi:hypothetical protein